MRSRVRRLSITPSITTCATWMFLGPSSRAIDCATWRRPPLAAAKAANCAEPRTDAVAPVKRIVPLPRGIMRRAASRPKRNPA